MSKDGRLFFIISFISLVEFLIFFFLDIFKYQGVIFLSPFIAFLIFQPFWFLIMKKIENIKISKRLFWTFSYLLLVPILFFLILPKYDYTTAGNIIKDKDKVGLELVELDRKARAISCNEDVGWFLERKLYFYSFKKKDGSVVNFIMNPKTGKILKTD